MHNCKHSRNIHASQMQRDSLFSSQKSTAVVFSSNTSIFVIRLFCFYLYLFCYINIKVFALLKENSKCENTRDRLWKDTHKVAVDGVLLFQRGIHCLIKNKTRTATWVERST